MPQPKKSSRSASSSKKRAAPKKKSTTPAPQDDNGPLGSLRDVLGRNVLLTGERLQETMDEAVRRGRMTRADAEELVQTILQAGRRQTQDLLSELEAATRRAPGGDKALAQVDRARRAAGVGSAFPISGYDDLTAAQITDRLADLTPAELRKVRDHERRNANRKSVLGAIDRKLD